MLSLPQAPIHKGKLVDKERMDDVIKMAEEDVGIRPEDKYLLMSNPTTMSNEDKAALLDITFEGHSFPGQSNEERKKLSPTFTMVLNF